MKKQLIVTIAMVAVLAGCGKKDAVPAVDDPHHPRDFGGTAMTPTKFNEAFCIGKDLDDQGKATCEAVVHAAVTDATKGAMPAGY